MNLNLLNIDKNIFPSRRFHKPKKSYIDLTEKQLDLINNFNEDVKSGKINFEEVPCLCGNNSFDLIASVDRYSFLQNTVMCKNCGLIQSNPRMTEESYESFYKSDFYRKSYEPEGNIEFYRKKKYTLETGEHIFNIVKKYKDINSNTNILELGAGGGWNLLPFIKKKANVLGIDYSPILVSAGKKYDINMKQGGIGEIEGDYDIIILCHVLEHFSDPVKALSSIIKHLEKDGLLYIEVPNILNFGMGQLQNAHTYYFSLKTFEHYCSQAGLELVENGPAQKIHMYGVFVKNSKNNITISLEQHYEEMYKILVKKRKRESLKFILEFLHLHTLIRKILTYPS